MANAPRQSAPMQQPLPNPAQGFDLFRPFRMLYTFTTTTVRDVLNCMAKWGARGFTAGGIAGVVAGLAMMTVPGPAVGILTMAVGGVIFGTLAGLAVGAALGILTGGVGNAGRIQAGEDMHSRRLDAEARSQHIDRVNDSNVDRILQQNQENDRNQGSYWQDRVSNEAGSHGRGL